MAEEEMTDIEAPQVEAEEAEETQVDADASAQAADVDAEQDQAPQFDPEDAEEARLFGWKSPDEWQGDKPEGYIGDPTEYLDRVRRSRIFKTMQEKVSKTEAQAQEQARKLETMNERALKRQREDYERQVQQIVAAQRQAVANGDTEQFDALEQQKTRIAPPQEDAPQRQPPPEVEEYRASNTWTQDPVLWHEAVQAVNAGFEAGALSTRAGPGEQIKFAEQTMQRKYPHLFQSQEPKPKPRQTVDGGGIAQSAPKASSAFSKLPADAKAQFQRYVKEGLFENTKQGQEEYANEYNAA